MISRRASDGNLSGTSQPQPTIAVKQAGPPERAVTMAVAQKTKQQQQGEDTVTQQLQTLQLEPAEYVHDDPSYVDEAALSQTQAQPIPRQRPTQQSPQQPPQPPQQQQQQQQQPYQPYSQAYTPYAHFHQPQPLYGSYIPYSPYAEHLGWRPPRPHSEQASPVNPPALAAHPSAPPFGLWGSPPMSPVGNHPAPPFLDARSRHDSFETLGGIPTGLGAHPAHAAHGSHATHAGQYYPPAPPSRQSFAAPQSAWTSPSAPSSFGFFTPYQQQQGAMEPTLQPGGTDWSTSPVNHPYNLQARTSWSAGSLRPLTEGTSPDQVGGVGVGKGAGGAAAGGVNVGVSAGGSAAANAAAVAAAAEKERERKAYHPQPPSRRSDWVMWVGNVPNNTSHEELWHYFNMTVPILNTEADAEPWRGPSSIFLISRSSCAFVNLSSQSDLDRAVAFFNGKPLRPWDTRCPRMVCRVRLKDDDLRSGVGAQRGTGMHREWVKEHKDQTPQPQPQTQAQATPVTQMRQLSTASIASVPPSPAIMEPPPDGEGRRRESVTGSGSKHGNSSGSFASTNSSFLTKHFPRRVFILKSLTTAELEESVKTGLWKTQQHNEPILDQAFRTSQGVFLIFGANRAGEFFGYARMVEPIDKERAKKAAAQLSQASITTPKRSGTGDSDRFFLSPYQTSRVHSLSPGELTPHEESYMRYAAPGARKTDPPGVPNHASALGEDPTKSGSTHSAPGAYRAQTFDPKTLVRDYFPPVPITVSQAIEAGQPSPSKDGAKRQQSLGGSTRPQTLDEQGVLHKDTLPSPPVEIVKPQERAEEQDEFAEDGWGQHAFRIEWLKVAPLPFSRTRHLRNPWNGDREVKVSRDGTEVEPTVGMQLMTEWNKAEVVPRFEPQLARIPQQAQQ